MVRENRSNRFPGDWFILLKAAFCGHFLHAEMVIQIILWPEFAHDTMVLTFNFCNLLAKRCTD